MNIQSVVFFDLDHTLLNENSRVDDDVFQAIQQLKANGNLPVISTGRNLYEIRELLKYLKIDTAITGNGTLVLYHGKTIFQAKIAPELVNSLSEYANSLGETLTVMNQDEYVITGDTRVGRQNYHYIKTPFPKIVNQPTKVINPITMLIVNTINNNRKYQVKFGNYLTFYHNTPYSSDVIPNGISKGKSIYKLLKKIKVPNISTYAFGDGINDVDMLRIVDCGIAMGNALSVVKNQAEFVTTNNKEGGIVNGLKHFKLIN